MYARLFVFWVKILGCLRFISVKCKVKGFTRPSCEEIQGE